MLAQRCGHYDQSHLNRDFRALAGASPTEFLAAASASFALGGVWYSPLLIARPWQRAAGLSDAQRAAAKPARTFGVAFAFSLVAAAVFALFLGPKPELDFALGAGSSAGLCWVVACFGVNDAFEQRPFALLAINGGDQTLEFTLFGAILGLWH